MPIIRSLQDLQRVRQDAIQRRLDTRLSHRVEITVDMGTPAIAAGARRTLQAVLDAIRDGGQDDINVERTGNIGRDSWEPIVTVRIGQEPLVTYGKVTPDVARRILAEHVGEGRIVEAHRISG